jgi:alkanesulfonate monooxygenase SsuD/methylene tetrahydromethanopterin reductase-like flavin-dependent oxidoreductase (luciferase family)
VAQDPAALRRVVDAFREGGGSEKPLYLQVHVAWAPTDEEAAAIAYDQWRTNVFDPPLCWDLAHPEQFDEAARYVRPDDVTSRVIVSSDPGRHVARLGELIAIGFDGIWLHHVGTEQQRFIEVFGEHVVPQLRQID